MYEVDIVPNSSNYSINDSITLVADDMDEVTLLINKALQNVYEVVVREKTR